MNIFLNQVSNRSELMKLESLTPKRDPGGEFRVRPGLSRFPLKIIKGGRTAP